MLALTAPEFADAATYQRTDGTINPITAYLPRSPLYDGPNLSPGVSLAGTAPNYPTAGPDRVLVENVNLEAADLSGASFYWTRFTGNLSNTSFRNATFEGVSIHANLAGSDFRGATIHGLFLDNSNASFADLSNLDLAVAISDTRLDGANLSNSDLTRFEMYEINNFDHANMRGVTAPGFWGDGSQFIGTNFEGANFEGARFNGANMWGNNLRNANFQDAYFSDVLGLVDMTNGIFDGARFVDGIQNSDLTNASFIGADFSYSEYWEGNTASGADFSGADFSNALNLGALTGSPYYDAATNFSGARLTMDSRSGPLFDPIAAGWTLVPEPGTGLLVGFGLLALARRPRHSDALDPR